MADGTKTPVRDPVAEAEERLRNGFLEAIGQGAGSVRVQKKNGAGKPVVCPGYQIINGDYDAFLEELSSDYQDGGEFVIRIAGADGQVITAGSVTLAPVPASKRRQEPARQEPAPARGGMSSDDRFIALMMESNKTMYQVMQANSDNMIKVLIAMIGNNKGGSDPAAMLNALIDAQQKMMPAPAASTGFDFEKAIDTMAKIREAFPDRDPPEGVAGIAAQFAPLLAGMLAAQQQQQAQAAAQAPAPAVPALPRPPVPTHWPAPSGQAPAPAQESAAPSIHQPAPGAPVQQPGQEDPNMIFFRLQPHIHAIQNLIAGAVNDGCNLADPEDMEVCAQELESYIDMQVRAYMLQPTDRDWLLDQYEANPAQLGQVLAMVGIGDANHVAVIQRAIAIHAQSLAVDDAQAGQGGNIPNT